MHGRLENQKKCGNTVNMGMRKLLPWTKKKTATTIMHKIRTLFLSWDIEKSSLIALRCAAMREVVASRATVPIS